MFDRLATRFSVAFWLLVVISFIVGFATLASAQQPAPPRDQALTQRLITEINNNLACSTSLIEAQNQIAKLQGELKAKEKSPEKPADPVRKKP